MSHTPSRPSADRNLLFGILALQMDFISRDALIQAMNAWVLDKAKPLGQILVEQGVLRPDRRELLEALVQQHLELHDGDAEQSLAAVRSVGSLRQELAGTGRQLGRSAGPLRRCRLVAARLDLEIERLLRAAPNCRDSLAGHGDSRQKRASRRQARPGGPSCRPRRRGRCGHC